MVVEENKKQSVNSENNVEKKSEINNKNNSKKSTNLAPNSNNNNNKNNNNQKSSNNRNKKNNNKKHKKSVNKSTVATATSNNTQNNTNKTNTTTEIKKETITEKKPNQINSNTKTTKTDITDDKTKEQKNEKEKGTAIVLENNKTQNESDNINLETNKKLDSTLEQRNLQKEKQAIEKEILENQPSKSQNQEKNSNFEQVKKEKTTYSKNIVAMTSLFVIIFLIIIIAIFSIFTFVNNNPSKISKGIYIYGIDVSELTKDEAKSKLESYYNEKLSHDIILTHNDYEVYITPSEISLQYDISSAINYAFQIGKNGNIFGDNYEIFSAMLNGIDITPTYTYDKSSLENILNNFSKELPDAVVDSNYYIENNNLIITLGSSGSIVDIENTISLLENAFYNLSYPDKKVELQTISKKPKKVDIENIHSEIYKEAKDAYYTTDPYVVYPSENGLDFKISVEEAKNMLSNTSEKEVTIPLKVLYPNVNTNMIGAEAFPDLLATYSTKYAASNKNRTTNLKLAAEKINGYVLLPGETFSYNSVVGERTISAGYKDAAVYENGQVVQGLGGGICQISTTLFNSVLLANLEIVELHNHQFVPSYVTAGYDATVVYGVKDFQFKNNRNYALKINCTVSNGIAKFEIWGVKEPTEYDVSVYATINSKTSTYIKSTTYRTLKLNGEVVSTEKIANYTYKVH